ncbi:nucleoside triphosphate pyrophosphohydrolase [Croceicoccus hydrothermalis]|uniref:nucleoside triphosphate pyrophosphohydrolase n=1 Tax=Croceicoccus hydrothermalis TaxID=2867964 RepID=UPI001EFAE27C
MARLRDPDTGCTWDIAQDFASIAPYTIEEAYEVADAIARRDTDDLRDELGDLLLQVVFHARIAEEAHLFDFAQIADGIAAKLRRRHPHIFADDTAEGSGHGNRNWETVKAEERAAKSQTGALDGVALGLPALLRAQKLQKRAARVGFDWPDDRGAAAKLAEEIQEFDAAQTDAERVEEAGDLLFSAVNLLRKRGIDAEEALRAANGKFERRFTDMERRAARDGHTFATLDLDAQEQLWQAAKRDEKDKKIAN